MNRVSLEDAIHLKYWFSEPPEQWDRIGEALRERSDLLEKSIERLSVQGIEDPFPLASADLFVEKAQRVITARAYRYLAAGTVFGVITIVTLVWAAVYLFSLGVYEMTSGAPLNGYLLTLVLTKAVSASAFLLALVYFTASLTRAFFHEATLLLNRRHALRFGRLYVYLKRGEVQLSDLEQAFQWNRSFESAFIDLKPDSMTKTLLHRIVDLPPSALREISSMISSVGRRQKGGKPNE